MSERDKDVLHRYLRTAREQLVAKLDGLTERQIRTPMVPTGTNLLGVVKHVASTELGYFSEVFDRPAGIATPWMEDDAEPNADLWATADESRDQILDLQRAAAAVADATIEELSLDARGVVPWWHPDRREVTLQQILVHMIGETARHAGHADILRELIDGSAGLRADDPNLPAQSPEAWAAYVERLDRVARSFDDAG